MDYVWRDYHPETMGYPEQWLDAQAVKTTGLDDGFRPFYAYWANEDGFVPGENFWCKVVFQDDEPFAVVAFCLSEHRISIMELIVKPEKRNQGRGSKLLKELLESTEIIGCPIHLCEAVIYPDNIASQKAFENAGFQYSCTHQDQDGASMLYIYKSGSDEGFC